MKPFEQRYAPDEIQATWFRRGSAIAALDGALRVTYRDASLDWLLDAAPKVSIVVREGERHVLSYEAFVEVTSAGPRVSIARIEPGPPKHSLRATVGRLLVSLGRLDRVGFRRS
ncbi:hypothetical protein J8I87_23090 [Paraburkholderia sp. LEh10]|uniref:hypothetical protein n=1 Tax=Paraburkholderia sp. LEh10 TaxID=2821353 RepID=UPI001AE734E1|nr:hypothetical protein [Paraburkholderia sp. LEh10]MBP0592570.1 hypothetical protein [Paraburkholderia sp. LEh10]